MFPLRDSNPSYTKPVVTVTIIVVNILVFLFQFSLDKFTRNDFVHAFGFVPDRFQWVDIFTSMFMHGGWMHVIANMMFLWVFGDNIEDILGKMKYLLFYLACGVAAALSHYLMNPDSRIPMIGASGAVAGVMGAYMVKFPRSKIVMLVFILVFFTTFEMPALWALAYWFVLQFFSGVGSLGSAADRGGTAYVAHVGGFLAGILLIYAMKPKERFLSRADFNW